MPGQHIRILNVEDSRRDAALIERELRKRGLDVSIQRVESEAAFREALESSDPDVILADVHLPLFDGNTALRIARELVPDIPFIFVSGSIGEERAIQALREGAADYILKDRLGRLAPAVTRALEERRERNLRHRSQEALRRSEERFQYAAQATHEVIWDYDVASGKVWYSDALAWVFGHEVRDDIDARWGLTLVHEADRERVARTFAAALESATRWSDEYRLQRANGTYADVTNSAVIVRGADGRPVRVLGAILDISARVRAERKHREGKERLAEAQSIARLGSYAIDADGNVSWSAEMYRIFGVDEHTFSPTIENVVALFHPDDRERVRALSRAPQADQPLGFEARVVRPDGSVRIVNCRMRVIQGSGEQGTTRVGTVQDVTDRVNSEAEIRRLGERNELILNSAAQGIIGVDRSLRVIFANVAASALTGFTEQELLGAASVLEILAPLTAEGVPVGVAPVALTIRDGMTRRTELQFRRKGAGYFPVEKTTSAIFEAGEIVGGVILFQDVTDKKRMQRQLAQSQRVESLGRVAATIAHEFNNVLMAIQPFAEVIQRRAEADERSMEAALHIMKSVARGKRITQEILRFTQPAAPVLQLVDAGAWMSDLLPELRAIVGSSVRIDFDRPPYPLYIRSDCEQMQQVIMNLVVNARDATEGRGRIRIDLDLSPDGSSVIVSVSDNGGGIPRDLLQTIFEPLFTTKRTGTGLGLSVAQQVVQRHGGSIEVESTAGEGTTFCISLPHAEFAQSNVAGPKAAPARPARSVRRVVVVDDEEDVAAGIAALLDEHGIEVEVAAAGAAAVAAVKSFRPDVVVLDVDLGDTTGAEVYEHLAAIDRDLPVIFSTGHADETQLTRYLARPNVTLLRKPYDVNDLLRAFDAVRRMPAVKAAV